MKDKIALEEHFAIDLTIEQSKIYSKPGVWEKLRSDLLDVEQQRLERMAASGTAFSILSLNAPGTQGIPDPAEATEVARRANDALAAFVARHPDRLGGFAALPMQDPEAAALELERCVATLGFQGSVRRLGSRAVPQYFVMVGGGSTDEGASFARLAAKVPARRMPEVVDRLIALYARERGEGESATAFYARVDVARVKALLADLERLQPGDAVPADFVDLGEAEEFAPVVLDGECSA